MPAIGTTARQLIIGTPDDPVSFEFHALSANTDIIVYSTADPNVTEDLGELQAGQSITLSGFVGSLYAMANSGTQNYGLVFIQYLSQTGAVEEVIKS